MCALAKPVSACCEADRCNVCRGMTGLHPLEVVKLEALVQVLSNDVPAVATRVHRLLAASIFPDAQSGPAAVAELLRQDPSAGQRFCRLLFTGPASRALATACNAAWHCLCCYSAADGHPAGRPVPSLHLHITVAALQPVSSDSPGRGAYMNCIIGSLVRKTICFL